MTRRHPSPILPALVLFSACLSGCSLEASVTSPRNSNTQVDNHLSNDGGGPLTQCPTDANCGTVQDSCGGLISCGTCSAPQACGGAGQPFVCGDPSACTSGSCLWTAQSGPNGGSLSGVWASSTTDVFAVGGYCQIFRSGGNGGWGDGSCSDGSVNLYSVWGSSPNDIYVGTGGNPLEGGTASIVWSKNDGATWSWGGPSNASVVHIWGTGVRGVSAQNVYFVGSVNEGANAGQGIITHTTGDGVYDSPFVTQYWLQGVWGSSATDIYAVGGKGTLLHSIGDGNWYPQTSPVGSVNFEAVWGSSASDVYVVGAGGTILHSTGDGTWVAQTTGLTTMLSASWGSGPNDVYVAGGDYTLGGVVLHSAGDGNWTRQTTPGAYSPFSSIWGSGNGEVYLVGNGEIQYRQ